MIRVIVAFFIVINVLVALWLLGSGASETKGSSVQMPVIQGDQLILLSEVSSTELRLLQEEETASIKEEAVVTEEDLAEVVDPELQLPEQCVLAGPFELEQQSSALNQRVSALGVDSEVLTETIETPGSFMVYIAPFVSAQEAQRELRVLQSSNIDSFVIADGELENGISLGVFSTRQNALTQQVRLERLGYQTLTRQFMIENDQFYLKFSGELLNALAEDYWPNISNEYKDISIEQKPCNEVASAGNFH